MSRPVTIESPDTLVPAQEAPKPAIANLPRSVLAELRAWRMKASLRFVGKSLGSTRGRDR